MMLRRYALMTLLMMFALGLVMLDSRQAASQDPPQPTVGQWTGTATFADTPAEMSFEVTADGTIANGTIKLVFQIPNMSEEMLNMMITSGCIVTFDAIAPDNGTVVGQFTSASEASGTFTATSCALQGYGDLEFTNPLNGTWTASGPAAEPPPSDDVTTTNTTNTASGVPTPSLIENHPNAGLTGRQLYTLHCEECHGKYGMGTEQAPAFEGGLTAQIVANSIRIAPEAMTVFPVDVIPDDQIDKIIDHVLRFDRESTPRNGYTVTTKDGAIVVPYSDSNTASSGGASTPVAAQASPTIAPTATPDPANMTPTVDPAVMADRVGAGREVYQQHCEDCHGRRGGGAADGPSVRSGEYTDSFITGRVRDNYELGEDDVSVEDLQALIEFIKRLQQ